MNFRKVENEHSSGISDANRSYFSQCGIVEMLCLIKVEKRLENIVEKHHAMYNVAVAGGLAVMGYYEEGERFDHYWDLVSPFFREVEVVKIVGGIVRAIPQQREIEYWRLRKVARDTMKINLSLEYYSRLATYSVDETNFLIDYITVKLIEKGILSARAVPVRVDDNIVNKLLISVTDKCSPKQNQENIRTDYYYPKPISGSFLI